MTKYLRWSGVPSILGGVVLPFAFLLHPMVTLDQLRTTPTPYTLVHILAGAALLLQLLGLLGWYKELRTGLKRPGHLGLLLACIGTVFEIVYLLADGFVVPLLASSAPVVPGGAGVHALFMQSAGPIVWTFPLFELCFVVGYVMLALVILDTHAFPRWTAYWLVGGALLFGPLTLLPSLVIDLGAALFGLGFLELGSIRLLRAGEQK